MNKTIKVIDLLNMIAKGEIEDKRTFKLLFPNKIHRSIYYDDSEPNCLNRLKNVSDDEPIYDDIEFNDEVEIIEEQPEIDIQSIKCMPEFTNSSSYDTLSVGANRQAINELIKAVKQLDNKINNK